MARFVSMRLKCDTVIPGLSERRKPQGVLKKRVTSRWLRPGVVFQG